MLEIPKIYVKANECDKNSSFDKANQFDKDNLSDMEKNSINGGNFNKIIN